MLLRTAKGQADEVHVIPQQSARYVAEDGSGDPDLAWVPGLQCFPEDTEHLLPEVPGYEGEEFPASVLPSK